MPSTTPPIDVATPPNWDSIPDEILCPLCEYNLRGIPEPRCPECGFKFEWDEVLNPTRRQHRFVFEHQGSRRARAFWKTAVAGLRPGKFWRELTPVQPSFPKRLFVYWLIAMAIACVGETGFVALMLYLEQPFYGRNSVELFSYAAMMSTPFWLLTFAWPLLSAASFFVYQFSMFRAKVREIHVLRCVLYSSDIAMWAGLALPILAVPWIVAIGTIPRDHAEQAIAIQMMCVPLLAWLIFSYRLCRALQLYLRFSHSIAMVLCGQIMTALTIAILVLYGSELLRWRF
ncbi:MAG TPA: hypothetical protein VH370_04160 [Humisphaera sp.]|jgi:hypothetical protein|nr:hypothetical protein [Humisphaera sp.]